MVIYLGLRTEGCPGYFNQEIFRTREEAEEWSGAWEDRWVLAINVETLETEDS